MIGRFALLTRSHRFAGAGVAALATAIICGSLGHQTAPSALAAAPAQPGAASASACAPKAIGLARTAEINTANGPRFGHQQYQDNDFLADGEIVLTFDDGPSSVFTPQILKVLEAHCTKATFFMVGSRALAEPRIVKDVARRGHTIGTHTWSHANLRAIGAVRAKDEIEMGISGVQRALGQPIAPFFRFPYLADSRAMMAHLKSRDTAMFSIDADAYDYKTLNPAEVHKAIIAQVTQKRKGIILFHDIQSSTAHALNGLLTDLSSRGFRVVHMVPGTKAVSQPAYDVMATREASRRLIATAANPLARRAVTWPLAAIQPNPVPLQQPQSLLPAPGPFAQPIVQPILPAPRRRLDDDNWMSRVFKN